jgi:hypothetical protein
MDPPGIPATIWPRTFEQFVMKLRSLTKKKSRVVYNSLSKLNKFPLQIWIQFIPVIQSFMEVTMLVKCKNYATDTTDACDPQP